MADGHVNYFFTGTILLKRIVQVHFPNVTLTTRNTSVSRVRRKSDCMRGGDRDEVPSLLNKDFKIYLLNSLLHA